MCRVRTLSEFTERPKLFPDCDSFCVPIVVQVPNISPSEADFKPCVDGHVIRDVPKVSLTTCGATAARVSWWSGNCLLVETQRRLIIDCGCFVHSALNLVIGGVKVETEPIQHTVTHPRPHYPIDTRLTQTRTSVGRCSLSSGPSCTSAASRSIEIHSNDLVHVFLTAHVHASAGAP